MYEVEFVDGSRTEFGANAIAENMYAQCDVDGNQFQLMDCIINHRKDMTEFRQPIQVQSHLEIPGILVQLGCIQRT